MGEMALQWERKAPKGRRTTFLIAEIAFNCNIPVMVVIVGVCAYLLGDELGSLA